MVTLESTFQALGYTSEVEQRNLIKLIAASGAFGQLPGVSGTLTDQQALSILKRVQFKDKKDAAEWLHDVTQEYMLRRPPGVERHDCDEPAFFQQNRGELLSALHGIGQIREIKPRAKHYDHVLVLGAMEGTVSTRLDTVPEIYNDGVRFGDVYLLGSERPLDPKHEPIASVATDVGSVMTEMQMMTARAYEKMDSWPEALRNALVDKDNKSKLHSVTTPQQAHGRANTQDTVKSWLEELKKLGKPLKGSVLVISSQQHTAYQHAAVTAELGPEFTVETIGARVPEDQVRIAVGMDAIARQVDVGFPKLLEALKNQPAAPPPKLELLDLAEIQPEPGTYQFRSHCDEKGVSEKRRREADHWDWNADGKPLIVHRRIDTLPDGSTRTVNKLVDGAHRYDKGMALKAKGLAPDKVAAIVLGPEYSTLAARTYGAYANMQYDLVQGQGRTDPCDLVDAAIALKDAEKVDPALLPKLDMTQGKLPIVQGLTRLSPKALKPVAEGAVPAEIAVRVGQEISDPVKQEEAIYNLKYRLSQGYNNCPCQSRAPEPFIELPPQEQLGYAAAVRQQQARDLPLSALRDLPGHLAKLKQRRTTAVAAAGASIG